MAGIVHLVGAGPGDPGLMTRRSLELIASADAILYDRLIPAGALDGARADAELVYVGKAPGDAAMPQEDINARLVELGAAGKHVVRLKGGDPFVFGRGGEEAEALRDAGVAFEVVPGVTAGVAAPAYAGIPVTHRDLSSAVAFVTGHEDPAKEESALDWNALARFPGTLVLYMGVKNLPRIAERLIAAGRPADEPAAVVERGTLPGQRAASAPLERDRLPRGGRGPARARHHGDRSRGRAARHARLDRVEAVVRQGGGRHAGAGAGERAGRAARGAWRRGDRGTGDPDRAACVRAAGDRRLRARVLHQPQRGAPAAGRRRAATRARSRACSWPPSGPAPRASWPRGGSAPTWSRRGRSRNRWSRRWRAWTVEGKRVLVARASEARDVLPDALRERGAEVDVLPLYETVAEPLSEEQRDALARATHITFTSSSTVRFFLDSHGGPLEGARVVSIGPVTSATARELGLEVHVEAERHDIDGLVDALLEDAR